MDLYLDCVGFFFSTHVGGYARVEGLSRRTVTSWIWACALLSFGFVLSWALHVLLKSTVGFL